MTVRRLVTRAETPAEELVLRAARADRAASLLATDRNELREREQWARRELREIGDLCDQIIRRRERLDAEIASMADFARVWAAGRERLRVERAAIDAALATLLAMEAAS